MRTPRAVRSSTALWLFAAAIPAVASADDTEIGSTNDTEIAGAADTGVSLPEAVRQALESNLDLAARRRALEANREEIGVARSALLPQITIGARGQLIDDERSDSSRGNNREESFLVAAGLNQVLYDETHWANFSIQKHVYAQQAQEFDSLRLGVVQDAADAFLELDRSRAVLAIQRRNREVTRRNLETSRARIAAGWSSDREILRWESQLAGNNSDVRSAEVLVLQSRFELNRVRDRPPESLTSPLPATIDEYGFVYAHASIAEAIAAPEQDRRMRDYLTRVGLARSPDLAALDASIAAAERQLTANRRAFWVPSVSLAAGVDHLVNGGNEKGADFNETEWGVQGVLEFPLLEGGAKFAELRQARETLASSRTQRRATALSLEQSIRAAFAQASGSYANVDFAHRQVEAARRNYELVDASYVLGVASILDLLDAQNQLLTAELAAVNALYGFLEDLVSAERQLALFPFLEPPGDVESLLDGVRRELGLRP
jgi:outer membrane protein TolC